MGKLKGLRKVMKHMAREVDPIIVPVLYEIASVWP